MKQRKILYLPTVKTVKCTMAFWWCFYLEEKKIVMTWLPHPLQRKEDVEVKRKTLFKTL